MGYDNQGLINLVADGVDLTGDKSTPLAVAAHKFVVPVDCMLVAVNTIPTTAPTASEVVSVQIGNTADPNAYATQVLTDAVVDVGIATGLTYVNESDNDTIRKIIPAGTEVAVAPVNDAAVVAGVVNVCLTLRTLNDL